MHLSTLSLATLGLLFLNTRRFAVNASSVISDIELSPSYLEAFDSDDTPEIDFELSEELDESSHPLHKRAEDCVQYHTVSGSDSCVKLAKEYHVSLTDIYNWNPQIKSGCPNLNNGKKYCVKKEEVPSHTTTTTNGCAKTHKATNSDTCDTLAKSNGISLSTFYKLNPQVNHSCSNLNTGSAYCVKAGSSSSKKTTTKKTSTKKSSSRHNSRKETRKKLQTHTTFTYYWIAQPNDYHGGKSVSIKTCRGESIGSVDENYANALVMEGTGIVGSKIVNLGDCTCNSFKCFELVDRKSDPYGLTAYGTPLRPYVTIASNDIKKNTKIYVPSLVGWKIPNTNKVHNGCLLVDDQSWSFAGHHIDFYVYEMTNYERLDGAHNVDYVDIYQGGSCKLLNYM